MLPQLKLRRKIPKAQYGSLRQDSGFANLPRLVVFCSFSGSDGECAPAAMATKSQNALTGRAIRQRGNVFFRRVRHREFCRSLSGSFLWWVMAANTARILAQARDDELFSSSKTDRYKEEYVFAFVEKWDELIDWDRRAAAEGGFFADVLTARGVKTVLDVATGTGFHSVMLKQAGFEVTSVDGSEMMLNKAVANGHQRGQPLTTIRADWRWLGQSVAGGFDAIICLGNSFTHLFADGDRRQALAHFHALLNPGGTLILDQRNYDALLDKTAQPSRKFYYCGKNVCARPILVDDTVARFRYEFADGAAFHLEMFPLRKAYVHQLMSESGFSNIETFADFQETVREYEPDFYIHIARKSKLTGRSA